MVVSMVFSLVRGLRVVSLKVMVLWVLKWRVVS